MGVLGAAVVKRRDSDSSGDDSDDESAAKVYAMREKLLTIIADDFTIKKVRRGRRGRGKSAYVCKNKVMRVRETFELQSLDGDTLYQIQERKARIRDTMKIEDGDGETVASIKKRLVGPMRDHYHVDIKGERDWEITALFWSMIIPLKRMEKLSQQFMISGLHQLRTRISLMLLRGRIMRWSCVVQ